MRELWKGMRNRLALHPQSRQGDVGPFGGRVLSEMLYIIQLKIFILDMTIS